MGSRTKVPAEITRLVHEINERPEQRLELYLRLHGKLEQLRAEGIEVPVEIARLERELAVERWAEAQGR
jgi:hypothetical protein